MHGRRVEMFHILVDVVGALLTARFIPWERYKPDEFVYLLLSNHTHTIFSVQPGNPEEAPVKVKTQGTTGGCVLTVAYQTILAR